MESAAECDSVFDGYAACSVAGNHFGAALIALWHHEQKEGWISSDDVRNHFKVRAHAEKN